MTYQYYIADVFTQEAFNGAQIAVLPAADGLTTEQMAAIAKEINLSETVFVFHPENAEKYRKMRTFSALGEEKDYVGHPIVATAYVLGHCGDIHLSEGINPFVFEQNSGPVDVNISAKNGKPVFVQFANKVSSVIDRFVPNDEELADLLSLKVSDLDHKKYSPRLVSCGLPYLIVPVWQYKSVRQARFNYIAWSQSTAPQTAAQEILLFAPKSPNADFNLRLLGPKIGLHEDPPVGNALPAFAAYLCSFEFTQQGTHAFTVERGDENTRRSIINIEMDNKGGSQLPIRVGGEGLIFAEGKIFI
ncbi:PhzF family phenazine biosynthesis protein [methane-oxidizing endosymbiont of Gigantopelta aegis]|uniref:PhzF family phenazine biosynthesis protein n=1 Tax=methane-oxidizing endosymbiont of Gigantopelta aegis TaxID=2794938 RepID=UPI0018DBD292|nr:PhzF family phenazine biosynthesis protein [methane-oxidizing endosymbiont of Gigantopelta aegis]